jgi:hypothetical protein
VKTKVSDEYNQLVCAQISRAPTCVTSDFFGVSLRALYGWLARTASRDSWDGIAGWQVLQGAMVSYRQLQPEERMTVASMKRQGWGCG